MSETLIPITISFQVPLTDAEGNPLQMEAFYRAGSLFSANPPPIVVLPGMVLSNVAAASPVSISQDGNNLTVALNLLSPANGINYGQDSLKLVTAAVQTLLLPEGERDAKLTKVLEDMVAFVSQFKKIQAP